MRPLFRMMQDRIDTVNRVLREQITGIRVVRAFVREPFETTRFATANRELTDTATTVGRLQASLFPIVMLILNISSVAVLWFGAQRIVDGEMQVGSLTAFLTYLIQILFVGDDGHVPADDRARGRRCRRTGSARCWRPSPRSCRRPSR